MSRKTVLLFIGLCLLIGGACATVSEIGCPYTYHKNGVSLYSASTPYTQFAMRWSYSQDVTANKIGVGDYTGYGSGPIGVRIVNDDNGKPGNTIYAYNYSATFLNKHLYTPTYIPLSGSFTLPANTPCWVIIDGRNISSENGITVATWDKDDPTVSEDGCVGLDYTRWTTAGWNGTAWVTPSKTGSLYDQYGSIALLNGSTFLGDGQWEIEEATHLVRDQYFDGETITNCPSQAFKINDVNIRMLTNGNHGNVYFVVLDSDYNVIANRTIIPTDEGTWKKQRYVFTPAIDIGAGNQTITCMINAPQTTDWSNGVQVRGIQYFTEAVSWPYGHRFTTSLTGLSNIWTDEETMSTDLMMNLTVTYGTINHYYVSPSGNDSYEGTTPNTPWKTLSHAGATLPANSTLYIMPGTYTSDTLTLSSNNTSIRPYSTTPVISGGEYGIESTSHSNINIDGIALNNQTATGISFYYGNNITVSNCTLVDGYDGIRFKFGNDTLAEDNTITNMSQHGIHVFNQEQSAGKYSRNNVVHNNVSNCGHNMIDIHSNVSNCRIAENDIYFTEAWTGNKNNIGMYLHNGNTPYLLIENNTFHHMGRPFVIYNVNDCMIRNNRFYDGLMWNTYNSPYISIQAENGTVPLNPFGCNNVTFSGNNFSDLGYVYYFYVSGSINAAFTNFTYTGNSYSNISEAYFRKVSDYPTTGMTFLNENFTNFTLTWDGNTIASGDLKFKNTTVTPQDNMGDIPYQVDGVATLDIDDDVTDVWYGDNYTPYPVANFSANVTSGVLPLTVQFNDSSTNGPTSWAWDFDSNGIIDSTDQNPTFQYRTKGNYTVHLTVSNELGSDSEAKSRYITVQNQPWIIWVYYYIRSHIFHIYVGGWLVD